MVKYSWYFVYTLPCSAIYYTILCYIVYNYWTVVVNLASMVMFPLLPEEFLREKTSKSGARLSKVCINLTEKCSMCVCLCV